jgi:hypothetical protein
MFRTRGGDRVRLPLRLSLPELLEHARGGACAAGPPRPGSSEAVQGANSRFALGPAPRPLS